MADVRRVLLESPALGDVGFEVTALFGEDALNRLFSFAAEVAVPRHGGEARSLARDLLRSPITLVYEEDGGAVARIHGIAGDVRLAELPDGGAADLCVTVVPRAWILTQARRSEIFLGRSLPEILAEKLSAAGLREGVDFVLALRGPYPARELVAQYAESDFAFISRLCEDAGITFFFDHRDGRDVLVMADTPDAFEPIARPGPELRFGARTDYHAAFEIARTLRRVPERALVHDHDHRAPRVDLLASAPTGLEAAWGRQVEYGVHVESPEQAEHLACVRAEEIAATHLVISGKSTEMALRAGATVVLVDDNGGEEELLLLRIVHRSHLPGEDAGRGERTWHNELTAIPKHVRYRPPRNTPKPRIPGLVRAVIDGAIKGPYAELDEAGRYKVRFGYDLSGRTDLLASRPVRMLQPHAGAAYGLHFPLRPGTEVMIAFLEGDPDRPVIVGAIPDAETPSPVEQANQTQNVLRTASSNELVMEDLAGRERVRLHTPHEDTTLQLGAAEEPEQGALLTTDASVTVASTRSINAATDRSVLLCGTSSALAGESAVLLAGVEGMLPAVRAGMRRIGSVMREIGAIGASLDSIAEPPFEPAEADADEVAGAVAPGAEHGAGGGRWSDLAADLAARARRAAAHAVVSMARAAAAHIDRSLGRVQSDPLGAPEGPSAVLGSLGTAALFGRDSALVFGDRAASLASASTASVAGGALAQLKSPARVEVAGGEEAKITSGGPADMEAGVVRIAGGYFPAREAPQLCEMTTVGVISRGELELVSGEDCVLVCAAKNVVVTAHEGSMELKAQQHAAISAGSVSVSAGPIAVTSSADIRVRADGSIEIEAAGDVRVKAAGAVQLEAPEVEVSAGTIALNGQVNIAGHLSVAGTVNGKRL